MLIEPTALPDVKLITPKRFFDERGWFMETFNARNLAAAGVEFSAAQENQSFSRTVGTVRGLHSQRTPFVQAKLVRVHRGAMFDVAVDTGRKRQHPRFGPALRWQDLCWTPIPKRRRKLKSSSKHS